MALPMTSEQRRHKRIEAERKTLVERVALLNAWVIDRLEIQEPYSWIFSYEYEYTSYPTKDNWGRIHYETIGEHVIYVNNVPVARGSFNSCKVALTVQSQVANHTFFKP